MKASKIAQLLSTLSLVSACVFGLVACTGTSGSTGGVAATVNGVEIQEDTVTSYIQNFRESYKLTEETAWGEYLASISSTPEDLRTNIIDFFVSQELVKQAAAENNITIESSRVDEIITSMKAQYESEEKWQEALTASGFTDETYRERVENTLMEQDLKAAVVTVEDPTEEEMLEYAQMYATQYDGAKRSSHILFNSADEATAQEVLDKIKAGDLDFVDAVHEHSLDTASAEQDGDVGWDALSSYVEAYTTALGPLEKDQVSDLVVSDYGIHIIKVTDVFNAPEELTKTDQIPAEFLESIKASIIDTKTTTAYNEWYESYKEAADVQVSDMPENLPYYVDMSAFSTDEDTTGDGTTDDGTTTDGTTDDGTTDEGTASADDTTTDGTEDATTEDATTDDATTDDSTAKEGTDDSTADDSSSSDQPSEAS